jgi:hypothetical protein
MDSIPWVHHSWEEGSLDYDGRLVRLQVYLNFNTIIHRQQPRSEDQDVPESSKRAACSFEPAKDVKDAIVSDNGRTLRIGMTLDPK